MSQGSWLDELPVEAAAIEVVEPKTQLEKLQEMQLSLLEKNVQIVEDVAHFRDIEPPMVLEDGTFVTQPIPKEWVDAVGPVEAERRMRVAQASWMSPKNAPVALAIAKSIVVGVTKAMAAQHSGPRTLNVAVVQMTAPLPEFVRREDTRKDRE